MAPARPGPRATPEPGRAGDKRSDPDCRFQALGADVAQHRSHVAPERFPGLEPVAHPRLVAVIDLEVTQTGNILFGPGGVAPDLPRSDSRTEAIPRAPTTGHRPLNPWSHSTSVDPTRPYDAGRRFNPRAHRKPIDSGKLRIVDFAHLLEATVGGHGVDPGDEPL